MARLNLVGDTYVLDPTAVAQIGQYANGYPQTVMGTIPISQLLGQQSYSYPQLGVPQNVPYNPASQVSTPSQYLLPQNVPYNLGQPFSVPYSNTSPVSSTPFSPQQLQSMLAISGIASPIGS